MTRRCKYLLPTLGVITLAAVFLFPLPRYAVRGLLRGESFYCGRPTSCWLDRISADHGPPSATKFDPPFQFLERFAEGNGPIDPLLEGDPRSLGVLQELLRSESPRVRPIACNGIGNIAHRARDAGQNLPQLEELVPVLIEFHNNGSRQDRLMARFALGNFGEAARQAIPLFETGLTEASPIARIWAAKGLLFIDADHPEALAVIIAALQDTDRTQRHNAVQGLHRYVEVHGEPGLQVLRRYCAPPVVL